MTSGWKTWENQRNLKILIDRLGPVDNWSNMTEINLDECDLSSLPPEVKH